MKFQRLLSSFLVPSLAVAVWGCADTDTDMPDATHEVNRPIYEGDTTVTEDPATTDYETRDTTTSPDADWTDDERDAANQAAPSIDRTTESPATPGTSESPTAESNDAATPQVNEDVEEEPASELPEETENQTESDASQP
jgi:hypothetical protein